MPRTCTICTNPRRAKIDKLIAEGVPTRRIAARFPSITETSIRRHKAHIRAAVVKVQAAAESRNGTNVWQKLEYMVEEAERQYRENHGLLKATWFREMRGAIEAGIKLGLEAHKERQTFSDVSPAVEQMIEEVTK